MTSLDAVTAWIGNYRTAWESNDPDDIANLFTDDAAYFTEPYAKPWLGREAIVAGWLEHQDAPGDTTFEWHPLIVTEDLAIIEATTRYAKPARTYSNMWVLRLDHNGQARQFTEWYMKHPD
ncbi:nuclear transport factor 2 family protein [Actinoplanes sp. NPDC049316]|uniref:nuclear transport factor 2 family protein n=1 Tax=Actinoplanes sp. NPDC049316 TaxID=3154727 RepID=UPI003433FEF7